MKGLEKAMQGVLEHFMRIQYECKGCGKHLHIKIPEGAANSDLIKALTILKAWCRRMGRTLVSVKTLLEGKEFDLEAKRAVELINKACDKVYLESELKDLIDDGTGAEQPDKDSL